MEKIRKKWNQKTCGFLISIFSVFFRFFAILARFWEAPGLPKIEKNQKKSTFSRVPF